MLRAVSRYRSARQPLTSANCARHYCSWPDPSNHDHRQGGARTEDGTHSRLDYLCTDERLDGQGSDDALVKDVLLRHTQKERCLIVIDSFAGHKTEAVRKLMRRYNIVPAFIPGGCMSKV